MPIEFTEDLFQNNDFKVTTDNNGDLVQTHKQTGAEFKFDSTKDRWIPVQGLDLEGATIDNAGSIDVDSLSATQLAQALDANGNDITNIGAADADSVSVDDQTINNLGTNAHPDSNQSIVTDTVTKVNLDRTGDLEDANVTAELNNDQLVIETSGKFEISGIVGYQENESWSDGDRMMTIIEVNGDTVANTFGRKTGTGFEYSPLISRTFQLDANDTVNLSAFQNSGADIDVDGKTDGDTTFLEVKRVG